MASLKTEILEYTGIFSFFLMTVLILLTLAVPSVDKGLYENSLRQIFINANSITVSPSEDFFYRLLSCPWNYQLKVIYYDKNGSLEIILETISGNRAVVVEKRERGDTYNLLHDNPRLLTISIGDIIIII